MVATTAAATAVHSFPLSPFPLSPMITYVSDRPATVAQKATARNPGESFRLLVRQPQGCPSTVRQ